MCGPVVAVLESLSYFVDHTKTQKPRDDRLNNALALTDIRSSSTLAWGAPNAVIERRKVMRTSSGARETCFSRKHLFTKETPWSKTCTAAQGSQVVWGPGYSMSWGAYDFARTLIGECFWGACCFWIFVGFICFALWFYLSLIVHSSCIFPTLKWLQLGQCRINCNLIHVDL